MPDRYIVLMQRRLVRPVPSSRARRALSDTPTTTKDRRAKVGRARGRRGQTFELEDEVEVDEDEDEALHTEEGEDGHLRPP